jgi:predicted AlkP superfamily phosphohydrolase/phosphomutase
MKQRCFILGLDCLGPEVLSPESLAELPNLRRLVSESLAGPLESTTPPITVPAWSSMLSGRDPGELGVYGFKNRRSYAYGDLLYATSAMVRFPRLWDHVAAAGGDSIVVGVPQTSPPPPVRGVLISGFESEGADLDDGKAFARPPEIAAELRALVGDYLFDVPNFRNVPRQQVVEQALTMTERRFRVMEHLLATRPWDFAMLCEIAPDRLHHCFWSDHDPSHRRHQPDSPFRGVIRDYYRFVDQWLGRLRGWLPADCALLVVSDHGARAMEGGVCINEVLRQAGWLVLHEEPDQPTPLRPQMVDWARTRAWGEGGYYARVFLNVEGREPQGIVPFEERDQARRELGQLLGTLALPGGPTLVNRVVWPEKAYRAVRGLAPDLIVLFADLAWRSLGSIGHGQAWLLGNDTGVDEANHAQDGIYVLHGTAAPAIPPASLAAPASPASPSNPSNPSNWQRASILDITPTVLAILGLPCPGDLAGASLLGAAPAAADGEERPGAVLTAVPPAAPAPATRS